MSAALFALTLAAAAPSLDQLSWMAGHWEGTDAEGVQMEESWLAPKGGLMLGVHRDLAAGKAVNYEQLRIEVRDGRIVYTSAPNGGPSTSFTLTALEGRRVVFANEAHDFPKRIIYWLAEDGALHARVEGEERGKAAAIEWRWTRAQPDRTRRP